jgi:hypothetical protein
MNHHGSMNRIYRLVWNQVRSAWLPVAENAKGRGKAGRSALPFRSRMEAAAILTVAGTALSLVCMPLAQTFNIEVNVGGLVASTLDMNDPESVGSTCSFSGSAAASVINDGTISAANGGLMRLFTAIAARNGACNIWILAQGVTRRIGGSEPCE